MGLDRKLVRALDGGLDRAHLVVDGHDRVFVPHLDAGADHAIHAVLHLGVAALRRIWVGVGVSVRNVTWHREVRWGAWML